MKQYGIISILLFVTLMVTSQNKNDLELIRSSFQEVKSEDDINSILAFQIEGSDRSEVNIVEAYKGAAQCMMANYVFSTLSKLKNFNEGKKILEASISENKDVENVYLRLLIQLNVPKILRYYKNVDEDIRFLEEHLAKAAIDSKYKRIMIKNLVSVTKRQEQKDMLLKIDLVESS